MERQPLPYFEFDDKAGCIRHLLEKDFPWARIQKFAPGLDLNNQPEIVRQPFPIILISDGLPAEVDGKIQRIIYPLRRNTANYDTPIILTTARALEGPEIRAYGARKVQMVNIMVDRGYNVLVEIMNASLPEELKSGHR